MMTPEELEARLAVERRRVIDAVIEAVKTVLAETRNELDALLQRRNCDFEVIAKSLTDRIAHMLRGEPRSDPPKMN
jgi:hypothetical protein